jgi:hypothetical protein
MCKLTYVLPLRRAVEIVRSAFTGLYSLDNVSELTALLALWRLAKYYEKIFEILE